MRKILKFTELFENETGLNRDQQEWLESYVDGEWNVNPVTGLVDIDGDFSCMADHIDGFKVGFGVVTGDFDCSRNQLRSLEGGPTKVGGSFDCSHNYIRSLDGSPREVGGDFTGGEYLQSLSGGPEEIGGLFWAECIIGNPFKWTTRGKLKKITDTVNATGRNAADKEKAKSTIKLLLTSIEDDNSLVDYLRSDEGHSFIGLVIKELPDSWRRIKSRLGEGTKEMEDLTDLGF